MTSARYRCSSLLMAKDQFTSRIPLLPTTTTVLELLWVINIHEWRKIYKEINALVNRS